MTKNHNHLISLKVIWLAFLSILLIKLLIHGLYPIMDTSEARYAEMARKMVELNNWITPMYDYDQPFWGKPPLAIWAQAISIKLFGLNEFSLRVPSWLFHLGSCLIIFLLAEGSKRHYTGLLASLIFTTCFLGFIASGAVITDPALCFFTLLAFYGFWKTITVNHYAYALLGFAGLGLGILSKGMVILMIFSIPAFMWLFFSKQWSKLTTIPWFTGISVMLVISVPWFVIAEMKTPGFLNYFFLGEHWQRFLVSDWEGDLYGDAHEEAIGTIWIFLFFSLLPWSLFAPRIWKNIRSNNSHNFNNWHKLLLCWGISTPLFFTLSQNILWTYVLPVLPAWSLLIADSLVIDKLKIKNILWIALIMPCIAILIIIEGSYFNNAKNQKNIINTWTTLSNEKKEPLFYLKRYYSADFYSLGKSQTITNINNLPKNKSFYLAIRDRDIEKYNAYDLNHCKLVKHIDKTNLLHCEQLT